MARDPTNKTIFFPIIYINQRPLVEKKIDNCCLGLTLETQNLKLCRQVIIKGADVLFSDSL